MNESLTIKHHCHNCRYTFEHPANDTYWKKPPPCLKCASSQAVAIGDGTMFGTCEALASYIYGQQIHAFTLITDNDIYEYCRDNAIEPTSQNVALISEQLKEDTSLLKCVENMLECASVPILIKGEKE